MGSASIDDRIHPENNLLAKGKWSSQCMMNIYKLDTLCCIIHMLQQSVSHLTNNSITRILISVIFEEGNNFHQIQMAAILTVYKEKRTKTKAVFGH